VRTVAYCGDYTALTTTKWGAKIYVDTRDTSLAPHIMLQGDWEPWVTNCIVTYLQKHEGCTFIDVGANVGWYTLLACGLRAKHVFSFEPNPRMAELLRKTLSVNGYKDDRVTLVQGACGAEAGISDFWADPVEVGGGHMTDGEENGRPDAPVESVAVVRIDDVLERHGYEHGYAIVKIDVEGFEPEVLAGMPKLLALTPIMFLEHAQSAGHRGMYVALHDIGYSLRHVLHSGHKSEPLDLNSVMALGVAETVLCLPPGYGT
jgi:FkbM family methyltransferase